ncbi:MAG: ABC transporter ATP-binding protein [Reichenbachiella sp.]|uniref:ABC transporter ATP-binding protein n=1 Tax=Reichenbachiella sp. TaxID=2184521 RepID=UPI0029672A06|nr:ABC transporter ATP-binding protein [Reichenbachiella sp.]MDW3212230.1 ABC transporter ATP-binding protein [Reichenbachiella sp.]
MSTILKVEGLSKTYQSGSKSLQVLHDISFSIQAGESLAIVGPSGSGKTTLLGLAAGLDQSDKGSVTIDQIKLNSLSEDERAQVRNEHVGFIFQNFQLIPTLSALENVMVPLELRGDKSASTIAHDLLAQVGLAERADHYPSQLSGGEQQRVAIARAFSNEPKILFADEPTGNLDEETGQKIEDLLFTLNREKGTALVLVTHDAELAEKTDHVIHLKGGKMIETTLKASIAS